ncbi:MAG: hypothetical protein J6M53_01690, partial [Bacteroidaceae bacterium]|nr:hypothetical protein [Bacteroidaceae bacterium]
GLLADVRDGIAGYAERASVKRHQKKSHYLAKRQTQKHTRWSNDRFGLNRAARSFFDSKHNDTFKPLGMHFQGLEICFPRLETAIPSLGNFVGEG